MSMAPVWDVAMFMAPNPGCSKPIASQLFRQIYPSTARQLIGVLMSTCSANPTMPRRTTFPVCDLGSAFLFASKVYLFCLDRFVRGKKGKFFIRGSCYFGQLVLFGRRRCAWCLTDNFGVGGKIAQCVLGCNNAILLGFIQGDYIRQRVCSFLPLEILFPSTLSAAFFSSPVFLCDVLRPLPV